MPAAKKDTSVRSRRNTASTASKLTDDTTVICPTLPERCDDEGMPITWKSETLEWWADLWASPMAAEYHTSDKHALFVLAILMDEFWTAPTTKLASEIRLQRVAFGLTPYDRRRLEWTIETTEEAKERGNDRKTRRAPAKKAGPDPRAVLSAVN